MDLFIDRGLTLVLLFAGYLFHTLMRVYEQDKSTPERTVTLAEICWDGPERWRTIVMVGLLFVIAVGGYTDAVFQAAGISFDGKGGLSVLLIAAGYNIDSISKKLFAIGKKKPGE